MDPKYTYLVLNAATISIPFLFSFEKKMAFYRKWPRLFPAIFIAAAVFLTWDHFFTTAPQTFEAVGKTFTGIWNFNPEFVLGVYLWGMPIEEWIFFFAIPYACIFIYEALIVYLPKDPLRNWGVPFTVFFGGALLIAGFLNLDKWYTAITFLGFSALLFIQIVIGKRYLSRFWGMYWVHLIPFFIINGFLTALPVVVYNNSENLGVRLGTVPVEDAFYSGFLLLLILTIYEYLNRSKVA